MNKSVNFNISLNITNDIGGLKYFLENLNVYMPYLILNIISSLLATFGNFLIIGSIISNADLKKNSTFIIMFNLAISEFLIGLIASPSIIFGIFVGKNFYSSHMYLCHFFATGVYVPCVTAFFNLALIAINNYFMIFYPNSTFFSNKNTVLCCLSTWVLALLSGCLSFAGFGSHVYDEKNLFCIFNRLEIVYSLISCILFSICPCLMIGYLYMRIFIKIKKLKTKIQSNTSSKRSKNESKLIKTLFFSFFLYAICWIPISVVFAISGFYNKIPALLHTLFMVAAFSHSAVNPIFYAFSNTKIRKAYLKFINRVFCLRKKKTLPNSSISTNNKDFASSYKNVVTFKAQTVTIIK